MKIWNTARELIEWLEHHHAPMHENGGVDEINVGGLSGDLADLQDPKDHTHQSAGSGVGGQLDHGLALTGLLDDDHPGYKQKHGIQTIGAVTFADDTHILTVATGITYWFNGTQKVISGSTTCDIDTYETLTTNTVYWFYFDDTSGTLKCSDDLPDFKTYVYVAAVFWNGTSGAASREHHSYIRNPNWHEWAHYTVGLRYESGLTLTEPTTSVDNALQIENGIIWDEDLEAVISQQTTCRIVYKASASIFTWVNSSLPYAGSGVQPQYLDTDNYTLTNVAASDFVCMWVYATNDIDRPIYIIPTHASTAHNIIALARAEVQPILAALNLSPEVKLIYRFIYKGNGAFQESNDYRLTQALPSGGIATVNAGSVAFIPTGDIAATTVQTAIEELDTEKQPLDSTLTSIALLGTAANKIAYTTDVDTWAEAAITAAGRSMVGAANAAAQLALVTPLTTRGDIMFRNATVSTRLAKGAENTVLVMGADDPAWSATLAGLTLTSPQINGTIGTTGLTMPAWIAGGIISGLSPTNYLDAGSGSVEVHTTGASQGVIIQSTQDTSGGCFFQGFQVSASPAAGDVLFRVEGKGKTSTGASSSYGYFSILIEDPTNASRDGKMEWVNRLNNTLTIGLRLSAAGDLKTTRHIEIDGDLNHDGSNVGFYGTAPIAKQAGVGVDAASIHAALVALGLIAA